MTCTVLNCRNDTTVTTFIFFTVHSNHDHSAIDEDNRATIYNMVVEVLIIKEMLCIIEKNYTILKKTKTTFQMHQNNNYGQINIKSKI